MTKEMYIALVNELAELKGISLSEAAKIIIEAVKSFNNKGEK